MTTVLFPMGVASGAVETALETLTTLTPQVAECIQQERAADLEALLVQNRIPEELRGEAVRQFAIGFSLFQAFSAPSRAKQLSAESVEQMLDQLTRERQRSQQIFDGAIAVARLDLIQQPERLFEEWTAIAQVLEKAGHRSKAQDLIEQVLEEIARHVSAVSELNLLQMATRLTDLQAVLHRLSGDREPAGRNAELLEKLDGVVVAIRNRDFRADYLRAFNQLFPADPSSRGEEMKAAFDAAFQRIVGSPEATGEPLFQMFKSLVNACIARAQQEGVHDGFDMTLNLILDRLTADERASGLLAQLANVVLNLPERPR